MPPRPASQRLEPAQRPETPSRRLRWLAYVSMALAVLVLTVPYPMGVDDTWIQIRTGQFIVEHGIPYTDPFSFTAGDRPYTEHEWFTCILFYLVYTYGGVVGMVLLKTAVVSLAYVLVVKTARGLGAQLGVITLAFAPMAYIVRSRVTERPHLVSTLALACYSYVFFRVRRGQLHPRWLWTLVPIHYVWSQMHGGWVQGVALLGCFALGEALIWARARYGGGSAARPLPGRTILQLAVLVPACLLVVCLGPYGRDFWGVVYETY